PPRELAGTLVTAGPPAETSPQQAHAAANRTHSCPRRTIMNDLPIGDYALLSDCRSAALVSRGGSVDWLCLPRFDGPSVFARLLDAGAGHWSIRPAGPPEVSRRYLPETMVVETTFRTPTGTLRLVDAMALGE